MENITRKGTLYGVSVGPGDPELLTLAAVRCIERCPVIAAPQTPAGNMLALEIARGAVDLAGKTIVPLRFAMVRDEAERSACHAAAAEALRGYLDAGQDVAVLNLGDVSIYATFDSLQAILQPQGYAVRRIAGVPSFCAAAAALGRSLTDGMDRPLTIAPGACTAQVLDAPGAKVLMKSGRQLPAVVEQLRARGLLAQSALAANCGMPGQQLIPDLAEAGAEPQAGYFAVVLVKGE